MKSIFLNLRSGRILVEFICGTRNARRSGSAAVLLLMLLLILTGLFARLGASDLTPLPCQAGALDTSFNGTGKVTTTIGTFDAGRSIAIQSDGKIVVAGYSSKPSGLVFTVVRYNSDGSLDTSFNGSGKVTTRIGQLDDEAFSVAIQADGKIVVAGFSYNGSNYDFAVARYNSDGSLDTSFNGTGKVTTPIGSDDDTGYAVAIQGDSKIVVSGRSWIGSGFAFALVRYNSNGSLDTSFNGTGKVTTDIGGNDDSGFSMAIQGDGKILVAGYSYNGSNEDFAVVRYNSNGSLDTSFNGTGKVTTPIGIGGDLGLGMAIQNDGKIVVAGYSSEINADFAVVRYNSDGSLDTSFNGTGKVTTPIGGGNDAGYSVAIQADGKIVVAGYSYAANADFAVVRYNTDGSLDTSFNGTGKVTTPIGTGDDFGYSVAIDGNDKIVVTGQSHIGSFDVAVVRYIGSCATPTPTPTPIPVVVGVSASPTQVTEGGSATYTVRSTTVVAQSVTVNYAMSGTASLGPDYTLNTSGTVTIPTGQSSGKAKLRSRTDTSTEGSETAIMTLQPGPGYTIGNKNQATVTIADP